MARPPIPSFACRTRSGFADRHVAVRPPAHLRLLPRCGVLLVVLAAALSVPSGVAAAAPCWPAPVSGAVVVDPFRPPDCRWCAGNRGLEYAVGSRVEVRAAAAGEVTFSGSVAGVDYVVVRLDNGWRLTYGRLTNRAVRVGESIEQLAVVGRVSGEFFFGLRIGDDYADPAPFIGRLVARPRLVPIDGTSPRPAPATTVRCTPDLPTRSRVPPGAS